MKYIVDAVAFLAYLADKLPKDANEIFQLAENKQVSLFLPSITLGECLYTIYKGKEVFGKIIPSEKIPLIFQILQFTDNFHLISMSLETWKIFNENIVPELHDRMVLALAIEHGATAILTSDPEIQTKYVCIW
ncbi:MAG: type II toxin-antitoxin system VapC family toxin [Promethearchaeota archaeon]